MHCQNKANGCLEAVALENYNSHCIENCGFRLIKCSVPNCNRQLKHSEETAHQLEHANQKIAEVTFRRKH